MISGKSSVVAHIGYPTHSFKAPMIYNPYFEQAGIDALVVPMGCQPDDYPHRLKTHYPKLEVTTGGKDPAGYSLVVNCTPMGMNDGDPLPVDVSRIAPEAFVGEVVMKTEMTAFLKAAQSRGCRFQVGTDMLFEQIPAYLEFFGFATTTAENLRAVAELQY